MCDFNLDFSANHTFKRLFSFKNWDKDGNGMISKKEFIEGYRELHEGVNQDVATALAIEIFD